MKTYRHLYPLVYDFENLFWAYRAARKGKRAREPVAAFIRKAEEELLALQKELQEHAYLPGAYHSFYVHEPKKRLISAAPFRDRVVHHALCQVIEPIWERRFIDSSYANRVGKGTHRALDCCQAYARKYPYILQCDVRQFFPSIDLAILRRELARLIADKEVLWLCDRILESGQGVLPEEYEMFWFPGDDIFSAIRPRGLPIGNLTSQFWANVYINGFDHFVKRELKCPAYLRFVDDFLLFSESKAQLQEWRSAVIDKMAELRLTIHESQAQVYPVEKGIPFLGFRVYPDHRRLKYTGLARYRRHLQKVIEAVTAGGQPVAKLQASISGWVNHVRYGNTWGLRRAVLGAVRV